MVLVGDGPLKQKMQDHPAEPIVCGNLTGHELARHYASADIFLFPSRSETFGNVTLEAMASGLAVVAFDYAAARQHIKNGNNGMLVSYESDEELLKAATTLANQPELVEQIRARARTSILGQDWSNIQSRLMKIYSDSTTEELTNSVVYGQ